MKLLSGLGRSVVHVLVNNMQVLLLLLLVRTTSSQPIIQEVFYDFDDDYGVDIDPADYVWTPPPVTTGRPTPVRPCGVICQFERQGRRTLRVPDSTVKPSGVVLLS